MPAPTIAPAVPSSVADLLRQCHHSWSLEIYANLELGHRL
jgi:hypothetical protein